MSTGSNPLGSSKSSKKKLGARTVLSTSLGLMSCIAIGVAGSSGGCLNRPIEPVEPRTTSTVVERITQTGVDKIDLLLGIDNSSSMADKQQILAKAVPDLVSRLVNPLCVDKSGAKQPTQPVSPTADCDTAGGFDREFPPILDINIGIVDSSLGGQGSDACADSDPMRNNNDMGHLVTRAPNKTMTYQGKGFLVWDPSSKRTPPGITDPNNLTAGIADLVLGTGQIGCGFEHQLESVTRFLVDPNPYGSLVKGTGGIPPVTPMGTDTVLLQQRADFLRANSLLAVILLSDENDCSINTLGPQNYAVLNNAPFFRASSVCATNPNDVCCYSCGLGVPKNCTSGADPVCSMNGGKLAATDDNINLKCWNQKKRYGFDALFPVKRYVNAFSQISIDPAAADLSVATGSKTAVQNPIFTDLSMTGQPVRDPGLVFFAGIVGVPYQAIAEDPTDLGKGFKTFDELTQADFYKQYVGDPDGHVDPVNPIMVESIASRGVPTSAPNGGDRTIPNSDDLQYACIADLSPSNPTGADCTSTLPDNPLCTNGGEPQVKFKGYPCLRELSVIQGLNSQGITASICPQNSTDETKDNFGYRPAVGSIIDRLKSKLGGQCLPFALKANNQGNVPCVVLEAAHVATGQVDCSQTAGRVPVDSTHQQAIAAAKADPLAPMPPGDWNSFCEIKQLAGDPTSASFKGSPADICQNTVDPTPAGVDGWCYIDAEVTPPVGNPTIVAKCPPNEQRLVRFVGKGAVQSGATAVISCSGDTE